MTAIGGGGTLARGVKKEFMFPLPAELDFDSVRCEAAFTGTACGEDAAFARGGRAGAGAVDGGVALTGAFRFS